MVDEPAGPTAASAANAARGGPPVTGAAPLATGGGAPQPVYDVRALEVRLGATRVVGPLDLQIPQGAFLGILGPNGSGKTTLLRALAGTVKPAAGEVLLYGKPTRAYRATDLARVVGVVPQQFSLEFGFAVAEMVAMGRYAHGGRLGTDDAAVAEALAATGLADLAERPVTQLSGGERQRALIAQTLAQETPVLLLDEPLNNLDLNHQLEIMQLLRRLHASGRTIAVVLHDLNIAAQYCEQMVLLDHGRVAAEGTAAEILDPKVILEVFRVRVAVHRQGARPYITPLWTRTHDAVSENETLKVHVMAGGGAASELLEELVVHGFTPTVGVVSVFDTDYVTAQRYELEVLSAPPFQPFPAEAVRQVEALAGESDALIVAPVFFSGGNIELLRVALDTVRRGGPVIFLDPDSTERRDLTEGRAVSLVKEALLAGAAAVGNTTEAIEMVLRITAARSR
jgi:iron complex transport system ATP-binding protein